MDLITYALLNKKKASLVNGKVPASQLPSYVDEVIEIAGKDSFPTEGDKSKIYIDTSTGSSYRWGGTSYFLTEASDLSNYYTKSEVDDKVKKVAAGVKAIAHESEALFDPNLSSFKDGDVVYATELNHAFTIGTNAFSNMDNLIPKIASFHTIYFAGGWYYNIGTDVKINDYMDFICLNGHASLNSAIEVTNGSFGAKNMDLGPITLTGGNIALENCKVENGIIHTATSAYSNIYLDNCTIGTQIKCNAKMNEFKIINSTLDNCPITLAKGATKIIVDNNRITSSADTSVIIIKQALTEASEIKDNIIVGDADNIVELSGIDGSKLIDKLTIAGNNLAFSKALLYLPATSTGLTSEQFDIRHNVICLGSAASLIRDDNNLGLEISSENITNIESKITVDQTFSGISANPQSGIAIQSALNKKASVEDLNSILVNTKHNTGIISLRDMNPVIHQLKIKTEPNAVIRKYGRNLMPYPYLFTETTLNGLTFTVNEEGCVIVNGTATDDTKCIIQTGNFIIGGKYAISGTAAGSSNNTYYLYITDNGTDILPLSESNIWIDCNTNDPFIIGILVKKDQTVENIAFKPQIEWGQRASKYQKYKEPVEFIADDTGKIDSITSEQDIITLVSPDGYDITVTYNRDVNRAIQEIQSYLSFETLE